jgi:glycosyltransferase involved in cell wall biosynthesis
MSRPRLLLLADAFDSQGGGEIVVAHLARALRDSWDVGILTTTRDREEVRQEEGFTVFRLRSHYHPRLRPLLSIANPLVIARVAHVVRRFRPDVAHAWNVHSHLSYESLRRVGRLGVPVVLTYQDAQPFCYSKFKCWIRSEAVCTSDPDYRADPRNCRSCRQHYRLLPPRNRIVRAYLRRHVGVGVSVSAALRSALEANGIPVAHVVHNGLPLNDPSLTQADGRRARLRHGWAGDRLLVTGGRLHFFKGQLLAVAAFARIAAERADARLVVLGKHDEFRDRVRDEAARLDLLDRVSFPGFLDARAYFACLAAADLFLNLSIYLDPFPTVNLEAMAMRVPVVGTCFGGTPEAVADGETGFIVNPFDAAHVAERTAAILDDADLRARLGAAARLQVEQFFPVERMAADYERIYAEVAGAPPARAAVVVGNG